MKCCLRGRACLRHLTLTDYWVGDLLDREPRLRDRDEHPCVDHAFVLVVAEPDTLLGAEGSQPPGVGEQQRMRADRTRRCS